MAEKVYVHSDQSGFSVHKSKDGAVREALKTNKAGSHEVRRKVEGWDGEKETSIGRSTLYPKELKD